jgi:hypothetical protein
VVTFTKTQLLALFAVTLVVVSGLSFFLGARHGANTAVTVLRSVSFGSRESNMRRLLELDGILASGDTALARRKTIAVAWAEYSSLEDDVNGLVLPPTDAMRDSIPAVRGAVDKYCQSDGAKFHGDSQFDICAEVVRRSNKSLERTREG